MGVTGGMPMEWVDNMRKRLDSLIESRGGVVPESSKGALMQASDPIKFVSKGWGYEKWIANSPSYCGKLLFIAKGKSAVITKATVSDIESTLVLNSLVDF